jgi:hypothetical protein
VECEPKVRSSDGVSLPSLAAMLREVLCRAGWFGWVRGGCWLSSQYLGGEGVWGAASHGTHTSSFILASCARVRFGRHRRTASTRWQSPERRRRGLTIPRSRASIGKDERPIVRHRGPGDGRPLTNSQAQHTHAHADAHKFKQVVSTFECTCRQPAGLPECTLKQRSKNQLWPATIELLWPIDRLASDLVVFAAFFGIHSVQMTSGEASSTSLASSTAAASPRL